jgi:hypothetical protein
VIVHHWYCPNCGRTDTTTVIAPHTRFHPCPKLLGLQAPFLPRGVKAKVEARIREDYVAGELVQLAPEDGRPYMGVETTRDDGTDFAVFAPAAAGFRIG